MPQNSEFLQYRILNVHSKVKKCKETGKWDSVNRKSDNKNRLLDKPPSKIGYSREFKADVFKSVQINEKRYGLTELRYIRLS